MSTLNKRLSFLIFNFGNKRLRNLWYTMSVVADMRKKNPLLDKKIEFVLVESGVNEYSKDFAEKTGFDYKYFVEDPLCTSHRSTLRNFAVSKASGDWVIVHDNDIIPDPTFFEEILDITKSTTLDYFSNFKDVINLTDTLSGTLISDLRDSNVYEYGYINGTNPEETQNFYTCDTRPHGFFTFTEATGGSFTIRRSVYEAVKFDEKYNDWGAEDNYFKLSVVEKVGWSKFGMLDKTLLHSYHIAADVNGYDGKVIFINSALNKNREMLFRALSEITPKLNTEKYSMELNKNIFIAKIKKES